MMLRGIAALSVLFPTAAGTINDGLPPERFMADNYATVVFTNRIEGFCGKLPAPAQIIACRRRTVEGQDVLFLPNPCGLGNVEFYARIACHELGHVNGWSADHED